MNFNYDDICRHIGHMYLNCQIQLETKDREALQLLQQNNMLQSELDALKKIIAQKENANDSRTEGTSG